MAQAHGTTIPAEATRRWFGTRSLVFMVLLAGAGLLAVWKFYLPPGHTRPTASQLSEPLLSAIRGGDHSTARSLLEQGADVNARDPAGDTALMQACLNADTEIVQLLLDWGAQVNARGTDGASALQRALHDPEKVRLLLGRGARVESRTLVAAAMIPGSRPTLEQLVRSGARGDARVGEFTALLAAISSGDLDAVTFLLDHGADPLARLGSECTTLNVAVQSGNPPIVSLLLKRGVEVNGQCEFPDFPGDMETPAMAAALLGHVECLRLLLEHGADVNTQGGDFERNALLGAATTDREEAVRLLLARGANVHAQDAQGHTALDWALRRGDTPIVQLLRRAGATASSSSSSITERPRVSNNTDFESIPRAVAASLPLLQTSGHVYRDKRHCITCHQHSLVAMAVGAARQRGLVVDEELAAQARTDVYEVLKPRISGLLLGEGVDPLLAPYTLAGLAAEEQPPSRLTDALVHYLVLRQKTDGRWQSDVNRPPEDASDFMFTALAVRGLQCYAPRGRAKEISERIERAGNWLASARPAETVDRVFQVLGLHWAGDQGVQTAAQTLLGEQRSDGGWAQVPTLPSDAYATGQVLFALHEAGRLSVSVGAYQKGIRFLLQNQLDDGSWFVPTRSFPVVKYINSGFPHGRSQFISAAASCWAILALVQAVPPAQQDGGELP
jgi:ankyrin repeat protein